jgi:hypothetical protein
MELHRQSLPKIQAAPDAVQLEVIFIERAADDPQIGSLLWREVDQIAAIPAETRDLLHQNGFQIGHVGSSPPPIVQSLLGLVSDVTSSDNSQNKPMAGIRKMLPPGMETELQTSEPLERCHVSIVEGGQSKTYDYEQVRCVFRMKSARLHDGWVRLDFQPEIHYGDLRVRHTPTDDGWAYRSRQKVDARHGQSFSLTMNVGEIALITAAPNQSESMGEWFFCRDDDGAKRQRLLIVRVADAGAAPTSRP